MKDNTVTIETALKKIADIRFSKSFNVDAKVIGRVEQFEGKKLTISSNFGTYIY